LGSSIAGLGGRGVKQRIGAFRIGAVLLEPFLMTIWFVFALMTVAAVFAVHGGWPRRNGNEAVGDQLRQLDRVKKILAVAIAIGVMMGSSAALAVQPDEIMADPVKEARARELSRELRCMVCQNQSIDDSEAPLARDLRLLVRERIAAGDSDAQVIDFLVARYGEFVLLKPRFESDTLLLWLLPPLVLAGGGLALWIHGRRRARSAAAAEAGAFHLTAEEEARLEALIADEAPPEKPA
jgi:cytochrome c-type biogenesis protein CcmH